MRKLILGAMRFVTKDEHNENLLNVSLTGDKGVITAEATDRFAAINGALSVTFEVEPFSVLILPSELKTLAEMLKTHDIRKIGPQGPNTLAVEMTSGETLLLTSKERTPDNFPDMESIFERTAAKELTDQDFGLDLDYLARLYQVVKKGGWRLSSRDKGPVLLVPIAKHTDNIQWQALVMKRRVTDAK